MRQCGCAAVSGLLFFFYNVPSHATEAPRGEALLRKNCGQCHALTAETSSPLKNAPNLWTRLRSYSSERLEFELSEGIGSRHKDMPQIQFSSDEIDRIESYLAGE